MKYRFLFPVLLGLAATAPAWSASFYSQRLEDAKAVYVAPSGTSDDTAALQQAVNRVQETTGQGIVLLAPGTYFIRDTIYIWPGIRLIGYGAERPVLILPANTLGFGEAAHEKLMIFFAGGRPRNPQASPSSIPDASPGTFYSALANGFVAGADGATGVAGG